MSATEVRDVPMHSKHPPGPTTAYVALGSNLGDPAAQVRRAIERLRHAAPDGFVSSSLWGSAPVDCPPDSPRFVNAVVDMNVSKYETPETFLALLQQWEKEFGRRPKGVMNEARSLDLDLIAWGDEIRNGPGLVLPHPRAHLRRFVLEPLREIAADLMLPGEGRSVSQLLANLPADPDLRRIATQADSVAVGQGPNLE